MKLLLTRHGQSEGNLGKLISGKRDFELTEKGIKQAQSLGKYIHEQGEQIDIVYGGSLSRTQDTVVHIIRELWSSISDSRPILYLENPLIYERGFGVFEGKTKEAIAEDFTIDIKGVHHYLVSLPESKKIQYGIETNHSIYSRANQVLLDLLQNYNDKTILIVGHGGFNRALYYALHGMGEEAFTQDIDQVLRFDHCSYSEIDIIDGNVIDIIINKDPRS